MMRFVQAGSYYSGRRATPRLIVLHSTQGPGAPTWAVPTADGIAGYFSRGPGVSSHYVCDEVETVQCVADGDTAFCAPGANADGIHIEQCGYAEYSEAEWSSGDNLVMLRDQVAPLVATLAARHRVPLRALTVADIQAGAAGVCDHNDISEAFPGGGHWDCGGGYPIDAVLAFAAGTGPTEEEDLNPAQEAKLDKALARVDKIGAVLDVEWAGWKFGDGRPITNLPQMLHFLHLETLKTLDKLDQDRSVASAGWKFPDGRPVRTLVEFVHMNTIMQMDQTDRLSAAIDTLTGALTAPRSATTGPSAGFADEVVNRLVERLKAAG